MGAAVSRVRVRVWSMLLMDDATEPPVLYQVPVVERAAAAPEASAHLIAALDDGTHLYDGPHDAAFTDVLLDLIVHERRAVAHGATAVGHYSGAPDAARPGPHVPASVLGGEQSNTSIIYRPDGAAPLICKVFRQLHHGDNPDVTLQTALAASGSPHVPPSVGDVVGEWDDVGRPDGRARGHLAFAQEFLPGVEDAWRVALLAAAGGRDFADDARALGVAVAEVHRSLGGAFPRERASAELIAAIDEAWQRRLTIGVAEVPALEPHRAAIAEYYARATQGAWPQLQRIHGDLHLGQVILSPSADGSCSTSRASRCGPWPSVAVPTCRCATWRACCARSTTSRARPRSCTRARRRGSDVGRLGPPGVHRRLYRGIRHRSQQVP
ncbi:maltokinase N-terminal cap-like domain-containing protein [Agromyces flavus]|uniref:maltokinase N-terminal cap-like domain-containing protein n=1 Tax=Agromyces flavus TaxID=589382 RepID=UPI002F90BCFD